MAMVADGHDDGFLGFPPFPLGPDDGFGRRLVRVAGSPDGRWELRIYGPNAAGRGLYAYARCHDPRLGCTFSLGPEDDVEAERIAFDWNLPRGAWGIFIDGACYALAVHRPLARVGRRRIHSRSGPRGRPFTREEMRFLWARRRGQRKGGPGFVIEE